MSRHLDVGKRGEDLAASYLKGQGYRIVERNVRTPFGEIDLIAAHRDVLVFVEVKSRTSVAYGGPELAVDADKRRRLSRAALCYIADRKMDDRLSRFDVIGISIKGSETDVEHWKDAFDLVTD